MGSLDDVLRSAQKLEMRKTKARTRWVAYDCGQKIWIAINRLPLGPLGAADQVIDDATHPAFNGPVFPSGHAAYTGYPPRHASKSFANRCIRIPKS